VNSLYKHTPYCFLNSKILLLINYNPSKVFSARVGHLDFFTGVATDSVSLGCYHQIPNQVAFGIKTGGGKKLTRRLGSRMLRDDATAAATKAGVTLPPMGAPLKSSAAVKLHKLVRATTQPRGDRRRGVNTWGRRLSAQRHSRGSLRPLGWYHMACTGSVDPHPLRWCYCTYLVSLASPPPRPRSHCRPWAPRSRAAPP
jgi:hypothetical protein